MNDTRQRDFIHPGGAGWISEFRFGLSRYELPECLRTEADGPRTFRMRVLTAWLTPCELVSSASSSPDGLQATPGHCSYECGPLGCSKPGDPACTTNMMASMVGLGSRCHLTHRMRSRSLPAFSTRSRPSKYISISSAKPYPSENVAHSLRSRSRKNIAKRAR